MFIDFKGEIVLNIFCCAAGVNEMQYTSGDVSKMMTYSPIVNGIELQSCVSNVFPNGFPIKKNIAAKVRSFYFFGGI